MFLFSKSLILCKDIEILFLENIFSQKTTSILGKVRLNMRFDTHCHTKEGSMDGKLPIADYVALLVKKGYDGMIVTDHDSYNGYREWQEVKQYSPYKDFVVIKGIEYDTIDGGHIIVVMPEDRPLKILEMRGLPLKTLIELVHRNGGILGPAHPCGERHLSITNTARYRKHTEIMSKFDFIEGYNPCESNESNAKASTYGKFYDLPCFGGSDAHRDSCVGHAYTDFPCDIRCADDLIAFVKSATYNDIQFGGYAYAGTAKKKLGPLNHLLVEGFWFYNRFASLYRHHKRKSELHYLDHIEPIIHGFRSKRVS